MIFQISQLITENQELRKKNLKIKHNLEEAMDKFEMIFGEKVDLENFAEALQVDSTSLAQSVQQVSSHHNVEGDIVILVSRHPSVTRFGCNSSETA